MNVRITPRTPKGRTVLYTNVGAPLTSDGHILTLPVIDADGHTRMSTRLPLKMIAEIALDEEGAAP